MTRLTLRRLRAIEGALNVLLAGPEGEGDWPDGITSADMTAALAWVWQEIDKREASQ